LCFMLGITASYLRDQINQIMSGVWCHTINNTCAFNTMQIIWVKGSMKMSKGTTVLKFRLKQANKWSSSAVILLMIWWQRHVLPAICQCCSCNQSIWPTQPTLSQLLVG
jgi:hypothetical protein